MVLHRLDAREVVPPQPFGANGPIVSFDIGVLLWLAPLDIDQADPCVLRPVLEPGADVFGAIVQTNGQGLSAPSNDLV